MAGFFVLHRELFDKPIWLNSTAEQKVILITLIKMANFEPKSWELNGKPFACQRGQFVTSAKTIAEKCGIGVTRQNIRTALVRFEKHEFLTMLSTKTGMLITICNYCKYQDVKTEPNQAANQQLTNSQPTANQQLTTSNNITIKQSKNITNNLLPDYDESPTQIQPDLPVEKVTKPKAPKKIRLSQDVELTEYFKTLALAYWQKNNRPDLNPVDEFEKFKNHHLAKANASADWQASWATWYANAVNFNSAPKQSRNQQSSIFNLSGQRYASGDL